MGTDKLSFAGIIIRSHVTVSDVIHVTRSDASCILCPEICYAYAQPEVAQYLP